MTPKVFAVFLVLLGILLVSAEGRRRWRQRGDRSRRRMHMSRDVQNSGSQYDDSDSTGPESRRPMQRLFQRYMPHRFRFGFGSRHNKQRWFDLDVSFGHFEGEQNWWEGPNVCKSETESQTNSTEDQGAITKHFSVQRQTCDVTETAYKCTTTVGILGSEKSSTVVYKCCHGYTRKEGQFGCNTELQLEDLIDTARNLNLTEYLRALESVALIEHLSEGNFTMFAPVDAAFGDNDELIAEVVPYELEQNDMPSLVMVSKPLVEEMVGDMRNLMMGHVVVGTSTSTELSDEQLLETGSPYKSKIRVNFYDTPEKMMTANCKKVVSADNLATNGVIHIVEEVLTPVTETLMDLIAKNPDMSHLKTALGRSELAQKLREDGQYTVFAPTDEAFRRMESKMRNRLLRGESCMAEVLKSHLLPNVICSGIIQGQVTTVNILGRHINLTRDNDNKIFVEGTQMLDADIMATNGVMHLLDEVIIPDEALDVVDIAGKQGASLFLELLEGRVNNLTKIDGVTLFLPTNQAVEAMDDAVLSDLINDPAELEKFLSYHVVPSERKCTSFVNDHLLETLNTDNKIRINEYSAFPFGMDWVQTAQCAPIRQKNIAACNGLVHTVDKVLLPPKGNVVDVLALDSRFSRFVSLLKKAGLADGLQEKGPFTIFAPTNQVFENMEDDSKLQDPDVLRSLLQNHVTRDTICCAGIFGSFWQHQHIRMQSGAVFMLGRTNDAPSIGRATLDSCDITATNGVVHAVNRILIKKRARVGWPFDLDMDWGFDF